MRGILDGKEASWKGQFGESLGKWHIGCKSEYRMDGVYESSTIVILEYGTTWQIVGYW